MLFGGVEHIDYNHKHNAIELTFDKVDEDGSTQRARILDVLKVEVFV